MISNKELLAMAEEARANAYAPYSKFQVGAALLAQNGTVYKGCNVENVSYGATICAERTAFVKAISSGETAFSKIAVAIEEGERIVPCGMCLQFMIEFGDIDVVFEDGKGGIVEKKLSELMPFSFDKSYLEK